MVGCTLVWDLPSLGRTFHRKVNEFMRDDYDKFPKNRAMEREIKRRMYNNKKEWNGRYVLFVDVSQPSLYDCHMDNLPLYPKMTPIAKSEMKEFYKRTDVSDEMKQQMKKEIASHDQCNGTLVLFVCIIDNGMPAKRIFETLVRTHVLPYR